MDGLDPKKFVLSRELNEVHLLLDNLSANPDKTFSLLAGDKDLQPDWLDRICEIGWPPQTSSSDDAAQAALLIRAKDRLNTLAQPASGATIAFTLLVTQEDDAAVDPPTRRSLAQNAYPGLVGRAKSFRRFMDWMQWILLGFLVFTFFFSCYVAFGFATLAQGADAQVALTAAQKRISDAETGVGDLPPGKAVKNPPAPPASPPGGVTSGPNYAIAFCDHAKLIPPVDKTSIPQFDSIAEMQACQAETRAEFAAQSIAGRLRAWLLFLVPRRAAAADSAEDFQETLLFAGSVFHILASTVLPVLYGLLGAAAAVVRSLSRKIKQSTLAPRDLLLSWQQLALGAVMGACIGLFVTQPSAGGQTGAGLIGSVALSSSALSFVAGFGVDQVFAALEALISRIFAVMQPGAAPVKPA
jgi:hypothetical protein